MQNKCCGVCKVFGLLVIIGAINWGVIGASGINYVDQILGAGTTASRAVYILIGLAGIAKLVSCFKACPACKK